MTKIKFCGITNKKDALEAAKLNVDMLGFVFYEKSKRFVEAKTVRDISNELPPYITRVGVFVNEEPDIVRAIAEEGMLDMLQFHGDETPDYCRRFKDDYKVMKAFRVKDAKSLKKVNDYDVDIYLFDTYTKDAAGGTGKSFDLKVLEGFEFLKPVIISGGLDADNVSSAIQKISPYGVDVSTGIEKSPGIKDEKLMKKFVESVRKVDYAAR